MALSKYWDKEYTFSKKVTESKFDSTIIGDLKVFANGFKLHFTKNGSYQLVDTYNQYITIGGFSKRDKIFSFIERNDSIFNFGSINEIGDIVFAFTRKPNLWISNINN